jgi:hypothetical protein
MMPGCASSLLLRAKTLQSFRSCPKLRWRGLPAVARLLFYFGAVIFASFVAAIVLRTEGKLPRNVGGGIGHVVRGTFNVCDFVAKLTEMAWGYPLPFLPFKNIVVGYPTMNEKAQAIVLGRLDPFNRHIFGAVTVAPRRYIELPSLNISLIGIAEACCRHQLLE